MKSYDKLIVKASEEKLRIWFFQIKIQDSISEAGHCAQSYMPASLTTFGLRDKQHYACYMHFRQHNNSLLVRLEWSDFARKVADFQHCMRGEIKCA